MSLRRLRAPGQTCDGTPGCGSATGDRGATAVLTALLFVVLFAFAVAAVEVADLQGRQLAADELADQAAFAGAQELPDPCRAVAAAVASLQGNAALLRSDTDLGLDDPPAALLARLSDRVLANGEVQVLRELDLDTPPGDDPAATDGSWLATGDCPVRAAEPLGPSPSGPGRVVRVTTPPATASLPLSAAAETRSGASGFAGGRSVQASASVELRTLASAQVVPFFLTGECLAGGGGSRVLVTTAFSPLDGSTRPGETGEDCLGPGRGDVGYFDSDRLSGAVAQGNELNLSLGMDHPLAALPGAPAAPCVADGVPAGARLDDVLGRAGNTCVRVYLDGSGRSRLWSAREVTDGLLDGWAPVVGRLDTASVTPAAAGRPDCDPAGVGEHAFGTSPPTTVRTTSLACYLGVDPTTGGRHSLADVAAGVPGSVDLSVYEDPRFFLVPVLPAAPTGPAGTSWWPVAGFRAAFVTDERVVPGATGRLAGSAATCSGTVGSAVGPDRQECHGVRLRLDSRLVETVSMFVFPTSVFPTDISGPDNGAAYVAGPRDLLIVE